MLRLHLQLNDDDRACGDLGFLFIDLRVCINAGSSDVFFFWAGVSSQMVPQVEKDTCRQSMKRDPVVPR